jgi:hypothetical protein
MINVISRVILKTITCTIIYGIYLNLRITSVRIVTNVFVRLMKRLTKKQVKVIVRMCAAMTILATDAMAFGELDEDEGQRICDEMFRLANKLAGPYPTNIGASYDIIEYVRNNV